MGHKFRRDRQEKWDRRNLRTISTHLPAFQATMLEICCHRMGISPYKLVQRYLQQVIAEQWGEEQPSPRRSATAARFGSAARCRGRLGKQGGVLAAPGRGKPAAPGADQTAGNRRHALARPPLARESQDTTPVKGR